MHPRKGEVHGTIVKEVDDGEFVDIELSKVLGGMSKNHVYKVGDVIRLKKENLTLVK